MVTKQLEEVIKKYRLEHKPNILYGCNVPKVKFVIPTPFGTHIEFSDYNFFFIQFNFNGIKFFTSDGANYFELLWSDIKSFKMKKILIISKMTIIKNDGTKLVFQINRKVVGCPWIKDNLKYLEEENYYYKENK